MLLETYKTGQTVINQHGVRVYGNNIVFFVHYFVSTPVHFNNHLHKHSFYEACYIIDGEGTYIENGISYPLKGEVFFVSRPDIWHQIKSQSGLCMAWIGFEISEADSDREAAAKYKRNLNTNHSCISAGENGSIASYMWNALLLGITQDHSLPDSSITSLTHAIISSFPKFFSNQSLMNGKLSGRTPTDIIYQAKLFIKDNLSTPLRINDVANYLHLSGRQLSRIFSEVLQQTYISYVRQVRIEEATVLLKTSTVTIKYVAEEVGFDNIHYFTRVFTEEKGISPARYRRDSENAN